MYIPYVMHRGLGNIQIKNFFQLCRQESVAYDLELKTGTTFLLMAGINQSILGLLTMGSNRMETVKLMSQAVEFLINQGDMPKQKRVELELKKRSDEIFFEDVILAVRSINT